MLTDLPPAEPGAGRRHNGGTTTGRHPNGTLRRLLAHPQLLAVSAVAGWNLWSLRAFLVPVAYLYDASVHEQMARSATRLLDKGHVPFSAWYPYMGMGSEQYLHYQSLASVITGLAGTAVGGDVAFRWSMLLLVGLWPFAVYGSGRLLGLSRWAAMASALAAPFVVSFTGIGFERGAYSWTGGAEVWTQLFGSWALTFAWALAWRALGQPRFVWAASALGGLTIALHFMSGYLALFGTMVMVLAGTGPWRVRLERGVLVLLGSLGSAIWVIGPLLLSRQWSSINQALAGTPYVRGYGAARELGWLFTGQIFDARRAVPVISVLVLCGAGLALVRWYADALARTLLLLLFGCLALSFGPTTWGALADLVPAHADLYFRRFSMGAQLAGVFLAGLGVEGVWKLCAHAARRAGAGRALRGAGAVVLCVGALAWAAPAWSEIASYDHSDAAVVRAQHSADKSDGAELAPLVAYVKAHPAGRVYAGLSSNWGNHFMVGYVPVFKYLVTKDVDEMVYMVPTLSLMLGPEAEFDQSNPADYALFGVGYILLPVGTAPPVPATQVMTRGPYSLWRVAGSGYAELVRVTGNMVADRADVGTQSLGLLQGLAPGEDLSVRYPGGPPPAQPQVPSAPPLGIAPPGQILSETPDLANGRFRARVDMQAPGTLLLSVAYEPGWQATVDGHPAQVTMMAPALLGVVLGPGTHSVRFVFVGFQWYLELWLAGAGTLAVLYWYGRRRAPR